MLLVGLGTAGTDPGEFPAPAQAMWMIRKTNRTLLAGNLTRMHEDRQSYSPRLPRGRVWPRFPPAAR